MKTQRRHELQTNTLARSLGHWIEAAKPYSRAVLAVTIAVMVALFAWLYLTAQSSKRLADGWTEYLQAVEGRNPDVLRDVASEYSGTMVAQWARLTLADWQLTSGSGQLLNNRTVARDQLRDASETYSALLLEASHDAIREQAMYGLARAYEALGELERARNQYRSLASKWPDGPFAKVAAARAKDLDEQDTKQFYDWIAKYEPPAPLSQEPGTPGVRPDFLSEPDAGGLKLPSSLDDPATPFSLELADDLSESEPPASEPEQPSEAPVAESNPDEPAAAPPN